MKLRTALKLGRVSNLPTIWTNCFVGIAIANITPDLNLIFICFAFSLFYIAGMFLNDLFDFEWDKIHQPKRPIVLGETTYREVGFYSIALLVIGVFFVFIASNEKQIPISIFSTSILIACIIIYDWKHKEWAAFSPWLMGMCRLLVYWTVALTGAPFSFSYALPGLCLMGYIAGITYLAQAEHLNNINTWWPICLLAAPLIYAISLARSSPFILVLALTLIIWLVISVKKLLPGKNRSIPQSISNLIAGICLIDALILAGMNYYNLAMIGILAFFFTLFIQKKIKAT